MVFRLGTSLKTSFPLYFLRFGACTCQKFLTNTYCIDSKFLTAPHTKSKKISTKAGFQISSSAIALVIFFAVVSVSFFSATTTHAAETEEEYVCADFAKPKEGEKADSSTSGTKTMDKGTGVKDAIKQTKVETTDNVEIKDGKVTVTSKCGKKGAIGKVCFSSGICIDKNKDGSIDDKKLEDAVKSEAIKKGIRDEVNKQMDAILRNAKKLQNLEALKLACASGLGSKESCNDLVSYSDLLRGLGVDNKEFLDALKKNPNAIKEMLADIAAGDTEAATKAAEKAGLKLGATTEQLKNLSEKVVRSLPDSVRKGISDLGTSLCEETGACSEKVKEAIRGFAAPGGIDRSAPVPKPTGKVYDQVIHPGGKPAAPLSRRNQLQPQRLGEIAEKARADACAAYGSNQCPITLDKMFAILPNESNGNVRIYGDGGRSTSIGQVHEPTARQLLSKYKSRYGEDYVLNAPNILRDPNLNPEWIAQQSLRMSALVIEDKIRAVGNNLSSVLKAYNGSGPRADAYRNRALGNLARLKSGNHSSYWQTAYNSALQTAKNGGLSQYHVTENVDSNALNNALRRGNVFGGNVFSAQTGNSPFSMGGLGDLLKKFTGGGGSFGGGGASGGSSGGSSSPSTPARSTSASQPLPPAKPPTSTAEPKQPEQTSEPVKPTLSLIAHPSTAQKGDSLNIIWSAVGVSDTQKCRLNIESTESKGTLAEGNEGTEVVQVPVTTQLTELRVTLLCIPRDTRISPEDARASITIKIK